MRYLQLAFMLLIQNSLYSQDFNTMTGDWIRVRAEYSNGQELPYNHYAKFYTRYYFAKDAVFQFVGSDSEKIPYKRLGNKLNIGPVLVFSIEQYSSNSLVLIQMEGNESIRHFFIPVDSFQVSQRVKYQSVVSGVDTIYTSNLGIEPIYINGNNEWVGYMMQGIGSTVAAEYTFIVNKDGTIGEVNILTTSNEKLNKRIIQLVKKTSGKWIPGTLNGKNINVKVKDRLSMRRG